MKILLLTETNHEDAARVGRLPFQFLFIRKVKTMSQVITVALRCVSFCFSLLPWLVGKMTSYPNYQSVHKLYHLVLHVHVYDLLFVSV